MLESTRPSVMPAGSNQTTRKLTRPRRLWRLRWAGPRSMRRRAPVAAMLLALLAQLPALASAQGAGGIDTGDTAGLLTSTALVLLVSIPGLALFCGELVGEKSVIAALLQTFAVTALVTVLWFDVGYSLAFSSNASGSLAAFVGGLSKAFFSGVA